MRRIPRPSLLTLVWLFATADLAAAGGIHPTVDALFSPPTCTSAPFNDVDTLDPYCPWIRQLKIDDLTGGCGGGNYCPKNPVSREQLAVMLERVLRDGPVAHTVFSRFGGRGSLARTVVGTESLGAVKAEYSSLVVGVGTTLFVDQGAAYIGAEYCEIAGTILATGVGFGYGGVSFEIGKGDAGSNGAGGVASSTSVPACLGGRGGQGGSAGPSSAAGGAGGGAAGSAIVRAAAAAVGFPEKLLCGGGGGGAGGATSGSGGTGGNGGGVVYLECGVLLFSGTIEASGGTGEDGGAGKGAGGGGGGGVVILRTRNLQLSGGTIDVSGGPGGGILNSASAGEAGYSELEIVD